MGSSSSTLSNSPGIPLNRKTSEVEFSLRMLCHWKELKQEILDYTGADEQVIVLKEAVSQLSDFGQIDTQIVRAVVVEVDQSPSEMLDFLFRTLPKTLFHITNGKQKELAGNLQTQLQLATSTLIVTTFVCGDHHISKFVRYLPILKPPTSNNILKDIQDQVRSTDREECCYDLEDGDTCGARAVRVKREPIISLPCTVIFSGPLSNDSLIYLKEINFTPLAIITESASGLNYYERSADGFRMAVGDGNTKRIDRNTFINAVAGISGKQVLSAFEALFRSRPHGVRVGPTPLSQEVVAFLEAMYEQGNGPIRLLNEAGTCAVASTVSCISTLPRNLKTFIMEKLVARGCEDGAISEHLLKKVLVYADKATERQVKNKFIPESFDEHLMNALFIRSVLRPAKSNRPNRSAFTTNGAAVYQVFDALFANRSCLQFIVKITFSETQSLEIPDCRGAPLCIWVPTVEDVIPTVADAANVWLEGMVVNLLATTHDHVILIHLSAEGKVLEQDDQTFYIYDELPAHLKVLNVEAVVACPMNSVDFSHVEKAYAKRSLKRSAAIVDNASKRTKTN